MVWYEMPESSSAEPDICFSSSGIAPPSQTQPRRVCPRQIPLILPCHRGAERLRRMMRIRVGLILINSIICRFAIIRVIVQEKIYSRRVCPHKIQSRKSLLAAYKPLFWLLQQCKLLAPETRGTVFSPHRNSPVTPIGSMMEPDTIPPSNVKSTSTEPLG